MSDQSKKKKVPLKGRKTVSKSVASSIKAIADKYSVVCQDFLFDLYTVLANKGMSLDYDEAVLRDLRKEDPARYWTVRDELNKTSIALKAVQDSPLFKTYLKSDPLEALDEICNNVAAAYTRMKAKAANGNQPPVVLPHSVNGPSVTQRGSFICDIINAAIDERTKELQSGNAANKEIDITDMSELVSKLFDAFDQAKSGVSPLACIASSDLYTRAVKAPNPLDKWVRECAEKYCKGGGLVVADWITNLAAKAGFADKKNVDTDDKSDKDNQRKMETLNDLVDANPADVVRPDFDSKAANKKLIVNKHTKQEDKKAHVVVLFDISLSMAADDCAQGRLSRHMYALVILGAILNKVVSRKDVVHVMPFANTVTDVITAKDKSSANLAFERCSFVRPIDGTSLSRAFTFACDYVKKDKAAEGFSKCDLVLITDAEDVYLPQDLRGMLPKNTKVRGIHVAPHLALKYTQLFKELCDHVVYGDWDIVNNMPELQGVLKGV